MKITIGDKECEIKVSKVQHTDLYKAILYKDGKPYDVTEVKPTLDGATVLGDQLVKRYQDAIKDMGSFGRYIAEHFINKKE